jgi:hypothetical protein
MSIYLGTCGRVALQRISLQGAKESIVDPGDVNASRKRFSFDFDPGMFITGDQLEIANTTGGILSFVSTSGWSDGVKKEGGKWFINVDELGGIRLYSTFGLALNGGEANAITLDPLGSSIPISVVVANNRHRVVGQLTSYELNTAVEAIDYTALGEQFRSQYSSLMSGSGRFTAVWDYIDTVGGGAWETSHYLLQLALRTEIGSEFRAQMFLKTTEQNPTGNVATSDDEIWYEITGVITQAAMQVAAASIVEVTADFVTTGPIQIRTQTVGIDAILQEDTGDIRLEQDAAARLLQEPV